MIAIAIQSCHRYSSSDVFVLCVACVRYVLCLFYFHISHRHPTRRVIATAITLNNSQHPLGRAVSAI